MRVCFDALCFSARRPAVVDEETQTVICKGIDSSLAVLHSGSDGSTAINNINNNNNNNNSEAAVSTIGDQASAAGHYSVAATAANMEDQAQSAAVIAVTVQQLPSHDGTLSMDIENTANNNVRDEKDTALIQQMDTRPSNNNQVDGAAILNFTIDKCIEDLRGIDFDSNSLNQLCTHFVWTPNEQKLLTIVQEKAMQIKELEGRLRQKENEIAELRSHLDKFQSVFPFSRARKTGTNGNIGQRQRAQGISAEPQNENSVLEMLHVTFPKYQKDTK